MAFSWLINGVLLTTYKSWDDPPSGYLLQKGDDILPSCVGIFHKPWNKDGGLIKQPGCKVSSLFAEHRSKVGPVDNQWKNYGVFNNSKKR